jgi:hypothetical protein
MPTTTFQGYNAQALTPDDNNDITIGGTSIDNLENGVCLYVGTGGDITVTMLSGQVVTFSNVPNGSFMPIQIKKLWSSGTGASNILGLY